MPIAASTLELSVGAITDAFAAAATRAVFDATTLFRTVYGIADGKYYGRYFAGADPLVPYLPAATSLAAMRALGVSQRAAAALAIELAKDLAAGEQVLYPASIIAVTEAVREAAAAPADAMRTLESLAIFDFPISGGADAIGAQIDAIAAAAQVLMRRAAGLSLAQATADYRPTSQQDAEGVRDDVADILDVIAVEAADRFEDGAYQAVDGTRIAVVEDLTARGADLAPIVVKTYQRNLAAVQLSYRLYGDALREGDLVARNNPPHPLFLPLSVEALAA